MKDTSDDAFNRILRILNASDQSEASIRAKLKRAGYSDGSVDEAISRAKEYTLIDDKRYAALFIESKSRAGKGMNGILRDLKHMNINIDEFEDSRLKDLTEIDTDQQIDQAVDLLNRKPPRSKNLFQGAYSKLMRNGYSSYIASAASRRWLEQKAL